MSFDKNLQKKKIYAANANRNVSALNVRSGAGTSNPVVKVANKNKLIGLATGNYKMNGSTKWIQVGYPDDMNKLVPKAIYGWVSYTYISVGSPSAPGGNTPVNDGQGGGLIPSNDTYDITEETIFEDLEKKDKWKWWKIAGGIAFLGGATTGGILLHRYNKKKKLKRKQTKK